MTPSQLNENEKQTDGNNENSCQLPELKGAGKTMLATGCQSTGQLPLLTATVLSAELRRILSHIRGQWERKPGQIS